MNTLENLFFGNIRPCDDKQSAEVRRKQNEMTDAIEKLKAATSDEHLREQIDAAFDRQPELIALSERDAFIDGFCLGIRIGAEVFSPAQL